jgi:hypothetical protein
VSASAGFAERYPADLRELLVANPDDSRELESRLRFWRSNLDGLRGRVAPVSAALRARSWQTMAAEMVDLAEHAA